MRIFSKTALEPSCHCIPLIHCHRYHTKLFILLILSLTACIQCKTLSYVKEGKIDSFNCTNVYFWQIPVDNEAAIHATSHIHQLHFSPEFLFYKFNREAFESLSTNDVTPELLSHTGTLIADWVPYEATALTPTPVSEQDELQYLLVCANDGLKSEHPCSGEVSVTVAVSYISAHESHITLVMERVAAIAVVAALITAPLAALALAVFLSLLFIYHRADSLTGSNSIATGRYSLLTTYFLALFGGAVGAHHWYLGRPGLALKYAFTGGYFGAGVVRDIFRAPDLVNDANILAAGFIAVPIGVSADSSICCTSSGVRNGPELRGLPDIDWVPDGDAPQFS
ncbi:TM2 domain [Carpediemonas membranifera]|uniref:TM2 domain n=1 Tax=Carpediemonas membranifera TaxID=201153 RepID=A0A8J6C0A3_9EUKA|nr:TM2 domain [Carpediemonas membranifera]|eukprot:KAG9396366.1 TM2 domain [Carpediemonas membranifera]